MPLDLGTSRPFATWLSQRAAVFAAGNGEASM